MTLPDTGDPLQQGDALLQLELCRCGSLSLKRAIETSFILFPGPLQGLITR